MSASSYIATHGLDPIPMDALTPSGSVDRAAKGTAPSPNAEGTAAAQAPTDEDGFTFWDFLDIINPLQHIPGVSTVYRELTGDQIGDVARVAGATLFGGPIGLALASADYVLKEATGGHLDEHAMAMINGTTVDGQPLEAETAVASISTPPSASAASASAAYAQAGYGADNTSESSSNMLAYATPASPPGTGPAQTSPGTAPSESVVASANKTPPLAGATATKTPTASTADGTLHPAGRSFTLNRSRDVRSTNAPVSDPQVDRFAAINGTARAGRVEIVSPTPADGAPPTLPPSPQGSAPQPPGPQATPSLDTNNPMITTGKGVNQPSADSLNRALQAQGLQANGNMPLGFFTPMAATNNGATQPTSLLDGLPQEAPSAEPQVLTQATSPQASRTPAASSSTPSSQSPTAGPMASQEPVQVPAWFDQAMQKAAANYQRTGSLTGTPAIAPPTTKTSS